MTNKSTIFLYVSASGQCIHVPELIRGLVAKNYTVYSILTPNVAQVTMPVPLMEVPGNHWIHAYEQEPLDRFPFGTMLVAPCTFNTFNKIALGLADNLATSMIADALGAGNRILIAPSMNRGLWSHPQTKSSLARLESWECEIVLSGNSKDGVVMAPVNEILEAVLRTDEK